MRERQISKLVLSPKFDFKRGGRENGSMPKTVKVEQKMNFRGKEDEKGTASTIESAKNLTSAFENGFGSTIVREEVDNYHSDNMIPRSSNSKRGFFSSSNLRPSI